MPARLRQGLAMDDDFKPTLTPDDPLLLDPGCCPGWLGFYVELVNPETRRRHDLLPTFLRLTAASRVELQLVDHVVIIDGERIDLGLALEAYASDSKAFDAYCRRVFDVLLPGLPWEMYAADGPALDVVELP